MTQSVGAGVKTELLLPYTTSCLSVKRREQDKTGLLLSQSLTFVFFNVILSITITITITILSSLPYYF
jgi:hypothetical protein